MQHDLYFLNVLSMKNEDRGVQTDRKKHLCPPQATLAAHKEKNIHVTHVTFTALLADEQSLCFQ